MKKNSKLIPPEAQRVFEGVLFDVYQWQQEQFDGSLATFEYLTRADGAFVIPVLENGKLLIAEDEQPGRSMKLTFPGGGIEENESPEVGARRELLEETGYEVGELVHWFSARPISKIDWYVHAYIGRGARKVAEPKFDPGERITLKEITFDELLELSENPSFQHTAMAADLVRAKYNPEARTLLEEKIFG